MSESNNIPPDTPVAGGGGGGVKTYKSKAELEDKIKKLTARYDDIVEKKKSLTAEKKETSAPLVTKAKDYDKKMKEIKDMIMKMMEKGVQGKPLKSLEIEGHKISVSISKKTKPVKKCDWAEKIHEVLNEHGIERADELSELISDALCKGDESESAVCSITKKK